MRPHAAVGTTPGTHERWYKQAVIYCLDVEIFHDSTGDGIGDFAGLTTRLDYLDRLGVTWLWLNPIHPSPNRDDGYDVSDFYSVDGRFGSLGDFAEFLHQATNRGLRVIIDLVIKHTSDQHPWFQSARSDPESPYQDWYVWSKEEPSDRYQWATFLRNHDEVDLGRLSEGEQADCFAAFGPEENMQLYGRGIRRRLAPMLGNQRRRIEMAYSLQFTLPGTPVLRYGEEIAMGDDLSLKERDAIRTPMQWTGKANTGFSTAPSNKLCHPVITDGEFGYQTVNVEAQRRDPNSLLHWMERMLHTLRECPEFGVGTCTAIDTGDLAILALRYHAPGGVMLAIHNLAERKKTVDLGPQPGQDGEPVEIFGETPGR